jgi:hypothetical protein
MCCKDKKERKLCNKTLNVYYDKTILSENLSYNKKTSHINDDGTPFDSSEVYKKSILKDDAGNIVGEGQFYDHFIKNGKETVMAYYTDSFKLLVDGTEEQYHFIVTATFPEKPLKLIKTYKLECTVDSDKPRPSFTHLTWDKSDPNKRVLTFFRKCLRK